MPYMRVTRSQSDPAVVEELLSLAPDYNAAVRQLPGLQDFHGGLDRATGKGITVAIFDTEEHARFPQEALDALLGAVGANLRATGIQIEGVDIYEVVS